MSNTHRAVAFINLKTLEENYYTIRSKLSPDVCLLCVVKADAYGHGAVEVSRLLESLGTFYLGVATIEEGIELRANGIKAPILIMSGIMPWDEISTLFHNDLTPVIYDFSTLTTICNASGHFQRPLRVHIKFDTGMGRLGFMPTDAQKAMNLLEGVRNIQIEGLMSHFASSELRDEYGLAQVAEFKKINDAFHRKGLHPTIIHMANSGAIVNYPEAHFSMVRAGISLYGSHASQELKKTLPTRPVMNFISKIALIREFPAGSALSYGRSFVTDKKTKIAYIPVGYADGYPRSLSNKGHVLIQNRRCNIVGRICMDWFLADVTDLDTANVQDEVILIGEGTQGVITADEVGEIAGTIPYEILCKISKRVKRVYV